MTLHHLTIGEAPELNTLLESSIRRWGTLILVFCLEISGEESIGYVERLLQCACPLLRTISGEGYAGSRITLNLHSDCLPSLQTLYLDRIWPIFSTSPTSVTELTFTCTCLDDLSPLLDAVKDGHLIQRLRINSSPGYYGDNLTAFPAATGKAVLSSLTHLEIEGMDVKLASAISQFLSYCDIPKLESLTIWLIRWFARRRVFENLCQDVVRC